MKNNTRLRHCQQEVRQVGSESNLNSRNFVSSQALQEWLGIGGVAKNQETAGRLRIEKDVSHFRRDGVGKRYVFSEKLLIARQASRTKTFSAIVECPG